MVKFCSTDTDQIPMGAKIESLRKTWWGICSSGTSDIKATLKTVNTVNTVNIVKSNREKDYVILGAVILIICWNVYLLTSLK